MEEVLVTPHCKRLLLAAYHRVIVLLLIGCWDLCLIRIQSCSFLLQELSNLLSVLHSSVMLVPDLTTDKEVQSSLECALHTLPPCL